MHDAADCSLEQNGAGQFEAPFGHPRATLPFDRVGYQISDWLEGQVRDGVRAAKQRASDGYHDLDHNDVLGRSEGSCSRA